MESETQRHLTTLGRGLTQVNLRLTQLAELLDARRPAASDAGRSLEVLLDLLEAVERTTAVPPTPAPTVAVLHRLLRVRPPPGADLSGLALARDHAVRQLEREGLVRTAASGPVDLRLHQVLETRETDDPALIDTIALTHRAGWHRTGDPPAVARFAQVTTWRLRAAP